MPMMSMHATRNPIATYMTGSIIWLRLLHNPDFYHIGTAQSAVPAMATINLNPAT
jgi:hypothetical protein